MGTALLQQVTPILLDWVGPLVLSREEVCRIPEGIPGVYLLHVFAAAVGGYPVFYAGQSRDLRDRLLQHLGERTAKLSVRAARELDRPYWSAAPILDTKRIAGVEAGLIRTLRPVCNVQVPSAEPVLVNLPPLSFVAVIT